MNLDPTIAEDIVDSIKDIIQHDINLFNTRGEIIASTNRARVGELHLGAKFAAESKSPLDVSFDEEFKGSRKGLNIPILFNDTVAAVIGITGDKEEVAPYGNIIKKMTEILLKENFSQLVSFNAQNQFRELSSALLSKFQDVPLINYLADVLEININVPRRIVIGQFVNHSTEDRYQLGAKPISQVLRTFLNNLPDSFYSINNNKFVLFLSLESIEKTNRLLNDIATSFQNAHNLSLYFGISTLQEDYTTYSTASDEAETALKWNHFLHTVEGANQATVAYEKIGLGILFANLDLCNSHEFIEQVFGDLPAETIEDFNIYFDEYAKVNGGITKGADNLYIHKNTFQNKLNLIYEKTGYNPRDLKDFPILWLGFRAYNWNKFLTR